MSLLKIRIKDGPPVKLTMFDLRTIALMAATLKAADIEREDKLVAEDAKILYTRVVFSDPEVEL